MTYEARRTPDEEEKPANAPARSHSAVFAALTADLLARKGEAKPALEPFAHARIAAGSARQMARGERHQIDRADRSEHAADACPLDSAHERDSARPESEANAPRFSPLTGAVAARARKLDTDRAESDKEACTDNLGACSRKAGTKRAAVAVRFTTHDYLRLRLAAAELETPAHDIIIAALDAYLDSRGVERFDECLCLKRAADKCEEIAAQSGERDTD